MDGAGFNDDEHHLIKSSKRREIELTFHHCLVVIVVLCHPRLAAVTLTPLLSMGHPPLPPSPTPTRAHNGNNGREIKILLPLFNCEHIKLAI